MPEASTCDGAPGAPGEVGDFHIFGNPPLGRFIFVPREVGGLRSRVDFARATTFNNIPHKWGTHTPLLLCLSSNCWRLAHHKTDVVIVPAWHLWSSLCAAKLATAMAAGKLLYRLGCTYANRYVDSLQSRTYFCCIVAGSRRNHFFTRWQKQLIRYVHHTQLSCS